MSDGDELRAKINQLSPVAVRLVARFVDSLGNPPVATAGDSWLNMDPGWVEAFGLGISVHHGATTEPLGNETFEIAFRNACEAMKWRLSPPGSATQRFVDVTVTTGDGRVRKLSLKSTRAKRLSEKTMHISKLTEAAWIQDMRSATARRRKTLELFRLYRDTVDAIVMLRAFSPPDAPFPIRYELVELPSEVFAALEKAPLTAFNADGPTIDCLYGGDPKAVRVSLDRSDSKITIKQIQLSACILHATWQVDTSS